MHGCLSSIRQIRRLRTTAFVLSSCPSAPLSISSNRRFLPVCRCYSSLLRSARHFSGTSSCPRFSVAVTSSFTPASAVEPTKLGGQERRALTLGVAMVGIGGSRVSLPRRQLNADGSLSSDSSSHAIGLSTITSATSASSSAQTSLDPSTARLDGFLARIHECNCGLERKNEFHPFISDGAAVGFIHSSNWPHLAAHPHVFASASHRQLPNDSFLEGCLPAIGLSDEVEGKSMEERSEAVGKVLQQLRDEGVITGWRDELYPVGTSFYSRPSFLIERAAATMFGSICYGVHLTAAVRPPPSPSAPSTNPPSGSSSSSSSGHGYGDGSERVPGTAGMSMWVARRSPNKPTYPNRLDHLVAGGQPYGMRCDLNVIKECGEEAGIPPEISRQAIPTGAVSYRTITPSNEMKRGVLFCYDLFLPPDFTPRNNDGEVASFALLPIEEVAEIVRTTAEFKTNCSVVIIDFLLRHGFFSADEEGFLELMQGLRQGECQ